MVRTHCGQRCRAPIAVELGALALLLLVAPASVRAEQPAAANSAAAPNDSTIDMTFDAAEADGDQPRPAVPWNEYNGRYFTARLGGGFLYDYANYSQDRNSKDQMNLSPKTDLRDFRLLLKGRFKFMPRVSYTVGYMYEKAKEEWRFRQTGFMVDVPELWGSLFIGRTKEGFSTSKIMVGYQGWTNERAAINDAFLPILADGIKWTGTIPSGKFVYNLGWFHDSRSENESFNRNDRQFAARGVWLPFAGGNSGDVLHLAFETRFAASNDGFLQYRSKPESFEAQSYAIDTGKFPAEHATTLGVEAYYRHGPLVVGSEYFFNMVSSREMNNPFFHGGEIFAAYTLTGETRPYNGRGAYFEKISPRLSVFDGGIGAWEAVLRYSYADLDSELVHGGKFWRITPVLNWHMSDNVRLEFVTGYGMLDRLGKDGSTVFFQSRIQFQL